MEAEFILSKEILRDQVKKLQDLGLAVSYSYKTNSVVGNVLQDLCPDVDFSIHSGEELDQIKDKSRIWFFTQAENLNELKRLLDVGVRRFVVDNKVDLDRLLEIIENEKVKIYLSLRMKFQEHRIGSGKYFVYGMTSKRVNEIIREISSNIYIAELGVHIHRKSQNTSEWEIIEEIKDSIEKDTLRKISFVNFGGGLPSEYRRYTGLVMDYIFVKLTEARDYLEGLGIKTFIEPGRFLAAPAIKLITEIKQIYDNNIVINTSLYNCALDTLLTGTKFLVEGELVDSEEGKDYLIKGNSPTRDDIFRYKVRLNSPKVGDKLIFLNAGAYNYSTDFFGYKKLNTQIVEIF